MALPNLRYELTAVQDNGRSQVSRFKTLPDAVAAAQRYYAKHPSEQAFNLTIKDRFAGHDSSLPDTSDQIVWSYPNGD